MLLQETRLLSFGGMRTNNCTCTLFFFYFLSEEIFHMHDFDVRPLKCYRWDVYDYTPWSLLVTMGIEDRVVKSETPVESISLFLLLLHCCQRQKRGSVERTDVLGFTSLSSH